MAAFVCQITTDYPLATGPNDTDPWIEAYAGSATDG